MRDGGRAREEKRECALLTYARPKTVGVPGAGIPNQIPRPRGAVLWRSNARAEPQSIVGPRGAAFCLKSSHVVARLSGFPYYDRIEHAYGSFVLAVTSTGASYRDYYLTDSRLLNVEP